MAKRTNVIELFEKVKIDPSWSFANKSRKETSYLSHCYHRYPAKFIPQVVSRLVERYTEAGDLVVDPFGGCGTTLVESKVMGRPSVGVDINPVATLITKAKITPINPPVLESAFINLKRRFDFYDSATKVNAPKHERIDYWFEPEEKNKLAFLLAEISKLENRDIRDFFYCGFSNILKNCSIWLQKSNKPTRDLEKAPPEPFETFSRQLKKMLRGNVDFFTLLEEKKILTTPCKVRCADARDIPVEDGSVSLIVTSPPYVTSYEYADLHQLTAFWFEYTQDLGDFRKRFIGSAYHNEKELRLNSSIAEDIKHQLLGECRKTAEGVATYFGEMNQAFEEMKRILKKGGRTCIVIGNTNLKGVKILNAEVFVEQLQNLGFGIETIIKREIPSKNLPSTRDPKTGRFVGATNENKTYVYPTEYILVMEKI